MIKVINNEEIFIIGYGSLLSRSSLAKTIGEELAMKKNYIPVIIKGYKRVYNYIPNKYSCSFSPETRYFCAAANLMIDNNNRENSEESNWFFNAAMIRVSYKELKLLKKREDNYNLKMVKTFDFYNPNRFLSNALLFTVDNTNYIVKDENIKPRPLDLFLSRNGAFNIGGKEFLKMFDSTSYLADERTTIKEYLQNELENNSIFSSNTLFPIFN